MSGPLLDVRGDIREPAMYGTPLGGCRHGIHGRGVQRVRERDLMTRDLQDALLLRAGNRS